MSRGPLAERPLARGLPAERQGARQGGLGSGRGSGFPRERSPWRRGRGRGPGAGGWAGRARRASAPSPAEHPSRDGLVQGRPVCAGQQEGWMARVPGGRQAGAARPRTHGGEGSRARGTPLAGKAGARPPRCGWGAQTGRRGERGGRGAGLAGELARAAVEARPRGRVGRSPGRSRSAGEGRRACHPPRGCVLRRGRGRGGARRGRGSGRGRMGEGGRVWARGRQGGRKSSSCSCSPLARKEALRRTEGSWCGGAGGGGRACVEKGSGAGRTGAFVRRAKRLACQEWDSNPRLQGRLRPERSALDRSAILTHGKTALLFPSKTVKKCCRMMLVSHFK